MLTKSATILIQTVVANLRKMKQPLNIFIPDQISRERLAKKLGLDFNENMQDWEYEVSTPKRLDDFFNEYDKEETTRKEKKILMEIIIDSSNDLCVENEKVFQTKYLKKLVERLENNSDLHIGSVKYWTDNKFEISKWL